MNNQTALNYRGTKFQTSTFKSISKSGNLALLPNTNKSLPEILFISSYPPRECGIATYSQDLIKALNNQYVDSFSIKVCALEAGEVNNSYPDEVKYVFDTQNSQKYVQMAQAINNDKRVKIVMVQHEFGLFDPQGVDFLKFLYRLTKPVIVVFHTVLPRPDEVLKAKVCNIAAACESIIVMTQNASQILMSDYGLTQEKINVIAHGTHLVPHLNKDILKEKFGFGGRKVISTFGLINSGKSIETTLDALPKIIEQHPEILFLVIGKTHSGVVKHEGERYRDMLEAKVKELKLENNVKFINKYLLLQDLLDYLQLTDIYLFTSKDPNQAVSGTFSYAMSCGCPIISTPIPHAKEVLKDNAGIIIDFESSEQLANGVNKLMGDDQLRREVSAGALKCIVPTVWENSAVAHASLLQKVAGKVETDFNMSEFKDLIGESSKSDSNTEGVGNTTTLQRKEKINLKYRIPIINLDHVRKMTTDLGIIQFSIINQPDITTGFTLDDNARALVAICMHYEHTGDPKDLNYLRTYMNFIKYCQQPSGDFLNYVDSDRQFTSQNEEVNLEDSNGRAIWALGYLISKSKFLPTTLTEMAKEVLDNALTQINTIHSTRAMAFTLKGLYYANLTKKSPEYTTLVKLLADRMVQMYQHENEATWHWFEGYMTYGNSILPEAMLCAFMETGNETYKKVAKESFDFLISKTFTEEGIKVISNRTWLKKGEEPSQFGEQPIDVAYTILALDKFYNVFENEDYATKMTDAFNWFLGKNHLHQIIYNPCTGGCYDGLEENCVNLNQGSESTVSYLMARMTIEKYS